jgi:hypothetical protein
LLARACGWSILYKFFYATVVVFVVVVEACNVVRSLKLVVVIVVLA